DRLPIEVERGSPVAGEHDVDARRFDLQIAGHIRETGKMSDDALELGRLLVEQLGIRTVERVIERAFLHAAADADRLWNRERDTQTRNAGEPGAEAVHDVDDGFFALPARDQVYHHAARRTGRSEHVATGVRVEGLDRRILYDDR